MEKKIKIGFIGFCGMSLGLRLISSYLKENGFKDIKILLFPNYFYKFNINKKLLKNIYSLLSGCDFIGLSVPSVYHKPALQITNYLKTKTKAPIIWGGYEPISNREVSIKEVDFVCFGEGEETCLKIAKALRDGKDIYSIPNLYTKKGNVIKRNPPEPLVENLDKYPFPDLDIKDHYLYNNKEDIFKSFTKKNLMDEPFENLLKQRGDFVVYHTLSTRGCPNSCTYCWNEMLKKRFKGKWLRTRSIKRLIEELKWVTKKFPEIDNIDFRDDTFLYRPTKEIQEFSKLYKKEINLPFHMTTTPISITEEKLKPLKECGLTFVKMGIESGSERVLRDIYKRPCNTKDIIKSARLIKKLKLKYMNTYDFIFNNPFETIEDNIKTLKLINKLPKPCNCLYNSLIYLPATELYKMAIKEGYLKQGEEYGVGHRTGKFDYLRFYIAFFPMFSFNFPKFMMNFFTNKKVVVFLQQEKFNKLFRILTVGFQSLQYVIEIFYHRVVQKGFSFKNFQNSFKVINYYLNSGKFKFRSKW